MLSVIFLLLGILSDFEKAVRQSTKPISGRRGCKLGFSNSIKLQLFAFPAPRSQLVLVRFLPVCVSDEMNALSLFLVRTCQLINTNYGNFLSLSLFLCLVSKQKHL